MNYIIFDLEWNQPPSEAATITQPLYLEGEIVEIGAVKLDEQFQIVDELRLFVTPKYYPKMHKRVASLTGISDRQLATSGLPFSQVYEQFVAWCGEEYAYMTWSMSDLPILIDNMIIHGIDITNLPVCYDVQRIFDREIMRGNTRYSLDTALSILNEKGDTAHDALHDARNTAKVCNHLDLEAYLEEYGARIFAEIPDGVSYETRQEILENQSLRQFTCPWCGAEITCEDWVSAGNNTFWGYGICPEEEDEFLLELSASGRRQQFYTAKRIVYEMSDDLWDLYMDRKELLGV